MKVRTRFAPSPTGYLHLGGVRAALFNALFASQHKGVFILRMEDTDAIRSDALHAEQQQLDLHWLGVDWQEGPKVDGPYGPYWQSQRQVIYEKYYKILEDKKLAYPCFCTEQELLLSRKLQLSRGIAPKYSGVCFKLQEEACLLRIKKGEPYSLRFHVPSLETVQFTDMVRGEQSMNTSEIGDFIVRRKDGTPPFLFCNAVDDAEMHVTHVLRGEDHLSNTPRQILILESLGLPVPQYGHLSLIVGDDGAPLSKRHGSYSLYEMRNQGYLPQAIMNYLARLGHAIDVPELLNFDQLAIYFNVQKLSHSPARFDPLQLHYWQKLSIQRLNIEEVWQWLGESIANLVPVKMRIPFAETIRANITFPEDAKTWAKIFFHEGVTIEEGIDYIKDAGEQFFVEAENAFDQYGVELTPILNEMQNTLHVKGKKLFMPLRIALTGREDGPELKQIVDLLGTKKIKFRLQHAFKIASDKGGPNVNHL